MRAQDYPSRVPMEPLAQAVERLTAAGYREHFRAESGRLRALGTGSLYEPESLVIEQIVRFEGASDPDDQAVLFALRSEPQGVRGTYVAAYGLYMDALDGAMIRRLTDGRRQVTTRSGRSA
jgi:hypothetical protein